MSNKHIWRGNQIGRAPSTDGAQKIENCWQVASPSRRHKGRRPPSGMGCGSVKSGHFFRAISVSTCDAPTITVGTQPDNAHSAVCTWDCALSWIEGNRPLSRASDPN